MYEPCYVPSHDYPDQRVECKKNRAFGGVAIGILLFGDAPYAFPPGSLENATSFKYPVHYRIVKAASVDAVVKPGASDAVLEESILAAKELENQGCRAIIGGCGYYANYLPQIRKEVTIPCFMSSLMQLPVILNSLPSDRKVVVICADGSVLPKADALKNCGVSDQSRLVIGGGVVSDIPEMTDEILKGTGGYNPKALERSVVATVEKFVKEDPSIGAVLLECTLYPPCSYAVQRAVNLPVFDFITMVDWVYSAVVKQPFLGYI
ncbi:MAG TPA: hypothetical protein PKD52_05450 [Clostridiales bacterium]|nr:hypothetical protein [Clostridiales bacterium]